MEKEEEKGIKREGMKRIGDVMEMKSYEIKESLGKDIEKRIERMERREREKI